jgi:hypothetical protein
MGEANDEIHSADEAHHNAEHLPQQSRVRAYAFRPPLLGHSFIPDTLVSWSSVGTPHTRILLRPDNTYSPLTPPATVSRCFNGIEMGQLVYQLGKIAPLSPTYCASQVKSPPPRQSLSDLRLSASQRSKDCYSPRPSLTHFSRTSEGRGRPHTAPSSAAGRHYRRPTPREPTGGISLSFKPQPASSDQERVMQTQRPVSAMPAHSHLKKASEALSQSLSQGLASYCYVARPSSPSFISPLHPRCPPPTATELRNRLIQTQERGPSLTYKQKLAKLKKLLD